MCSVGLLANVGVAFSVYDHEPIWWVAGAAGALMGVVWNYAMSGLLSGASGEGTPAAFLLDGPG